MTEMAEQALRTGGAKRWSQRIFAAEPRQNGHSAEESWQDEAPAPSLARRLEWDPSFRGRAFHWLFIKGGMAVVLIGGVMLLGLIAGLLGAR
jgi:hypothetical protein